MSRFVILGFSAAACAAVVYFYNHCQRKPVQEIEESPVEVKVDEVVEEPVSEIIQVIEESPTVEVQVAEVVEEPLFKIVEVIEESPKVEVLEDECLGATALPEPIDDIAQQKAEAKRLRQEREKHLYDKWLAVKEGENKPRITTVVADEKVAEELILDINIRMVLVKLRTVDRFALNILRCVSSTPTKTVYLASGEQDLQFAFTVYHQGKPAKKEFKRLLELEESGAAGVPTPVLHRGHVLLTKWIDDFSDLAVAVQQPVPDPLAEMSRKERKKAVKLAQSQNRQKAHLKEVHNSHTSQRKIISQRLYHNNKDGDSKDGDNINVM